MACLLGWPASDVEALEAGFLYPGADQVAHYLGACRVGTADFERIMALCRCAEGWQLTFEHPAGVSEGARAVMVHEESARSVFAYAADSLPMLLQGESYARLRVESDQGVDEVERNRRVAARLARRRILSDGHSRQLRTFVLHEVVLLMVVGGTDVMYEQLTHLVALMDEGVSIRVLPMNAPAVGWDQASFSLLDFANHRPAVCLDFPTCTVMSDEPDVVAAYRSMSGQLRAAALDEAATGALLGKWAGRYAAHQVPTPLDAPVRG